MADDRTNAPRPQRWGAAYANLLVQVPSTPTAAGEGGSPRGQRYGLVVTVVSNADPHRRRASTRWVAFRRGDD
jgi:hypothetical protein